MIRMLPSMLLLVVLCACAAPPPTVPDIVVAQEDPNRVLDVDYLPEIEPFDIDRKRVYYTRVNFWYEFLRHKTTNYSRGQLVPINSKVTLKTLVGQRHRESRKPEIFDLRVSLLDSETRIAIWNVEHHSRASMYEIIYRMFSPEPVNLEVFDEEMQAVIKSGELRVGMTRYQTLLASPHYSRRAVAETSLR
jgi:hypothetical protein